MTDICRKKVQLICEMHPNSCRHSVYMHPCVTIKSHLKTCYCIRLLGNTCPSIRTSTEPQKCVGKPHPYISMYTIDGSRTCCNAMQAYRHERNKQCSSGPVYFLLYDTTPLLTGTKVLGWRADPLQNYLCHQSFRRQPRNISSLFRAMSLRSHLTPQHRSILKWCRTACSLAPMTTCWNIVWAWALICTRMCSETQAIVGTCEKQL